MLRLLALVLLPTTLVGQQAQCPRPASDTAALELAAVEHRPIADSGNAPPFYPQLLQQARVGGPVRVLFTVDTAGLPEPASIRVARSPNPGFDAVVKRAVARWRFAPASHCARRVRVRLAHEFLFQATPPDTSRLARIFLEVDTTVTLVRDTLPDGTPRTTLAARRSPPVLADVRWDSLAADSAEEAVLTNLVGELRWWKGSLPGEDPFHVRVMKRQAIAPERFVFEVDIEQGTGGWHHQCGAEHRRTGWWTQCIIVSSWAN